jgi:hypothetical protein
MLREEDFPHWRVSGAHLRIAAINTTARLKRANDSHGSGEHVLKWITGGKVDHPLADIKQARALVAELPPLDAVKALEEITGWLESLPDAEGFKLDRLYEAVDLLDNAGRNPHRKIAQDYLATSRQQKYQENKLWTCGYRFSKALVGAYLHCARQHEKGVSGAAAIRKQMPLIVARALRSLGLQVKWTMLRYGPFEAGLWTSIGELYGIAAKGTYAKTALTVYPGVHGTSSVEQDYLKIMMLWASSADALPPLKQEIAERAAAQLVDAFRIDRSPFEGAIYRFDPSQNRPPSRMFQVSPAPHELHYFGPGDAPARLAAVIAAIEKSRKLPPDFNLGAVYPEEAVFAVLRHLAAYWSDKPPARLSERRAASARITVVPGYTQLVDELEREESDALNFSVSGAESWVVENVSENGYGALVPAATTEWIRVGELIGVQLEGTPDWSLALVRRVVRDEQRQYHVGIEIMSRALRLVRVCHAAGRDAEPAVLLSAAAELAGEVALLVRAGRYNPDVDITVEVGERKYVLMPSRLVDAGDDFDWAVYAAI